MTRYYFTDPLVAALVARKFDLKFQSRDSQDLRMMVSVYGGYDWYYEKKVAVDGKISSLGYRGDFFYIHPDSLPILLEKLNTDAAQALHLLGMWPLEEREKAA